MKSLLAIADPERVTEFFRKIISQENSTSNMLDLAMYMVPHLPVEPVFTNSPLYAFYQILMSQLSSKDATIIKKTYKALVQIMCLPNIDLDFAEFTQRLLSEECVTALVSGATKARVNLLSKITGLLNGQALLEFVPQALPEVMLATKEASEKSRDAAYACLVGMCTKMMEGNETETVDNGDPMEEDHVAHQNVQEFIMMVVAGLSGASLHMQSASIASLARLLFEFHSSMPDATIGEILTTVVYTMNNSTQAEIIKASLGLIKVSVVCTTISSVNLASVVTSILEHAKHKSKFRVKVRHILERLIRKYGYEAIDEHVPEADKKLILNIKKRRERLKKRKNGPAKDEVAKTSFEDALHGSESELGSDRENDDETSYLPEQFKPDPKTRKQMQIREDGDVVDFLDANVISQVTNTRKPKPASKPYKSYETNEAGQLILEDSDSEAEVKVKEVSEDYYKMSLASEVSFTRKADGRIKFDKRKHESVDEAPTVGKRWHQKNVGPKKQKTADLGKAYKSSKAAGDVKRAGMPDPHAYIPLSGQVVGNM
jgi:ribosomal RNA-processing protein 12